MKIRPHFSIITPSFGQLEWLKLCAASIADQPGVDFEHIVQDAGTSPALEAWADQQPTVKLFVEKDLGMYDAINRGLAKAQGNICAYLNCDEQYLPGALRTVVGYFDSHPEIDLLFADAILVNEEGRPLSYRRTIVPSISHLRLADLNALTCAMFFRRRLVEAGHLFPTHLKIAGDQYWIFQLLKAGVKMAALPEPLSIFTLTGANLSQRRHPETFGWLPKDERPRRWLTPYFVLWHRLRKFFAGAYRRRDVTIDIYTRNSPRHRTRITGKSVGFQWPRF